MDRRNFLRTASSFTLLTVGATTDASRTTGESIGKYLNLDKLPGMCAKEPMTADGIIRLSKIEVYPQYLDKYINYATEVGEISLRSEPGVLTMYAIGEKENPCKKRMSALALNSAGTKDLLFQYRAAKLPTVLFPDPSPYIGQPA